jgi:hypothetical protein
MRGSYVSTATLEQHRSDASFVGFAAWMVMAGAVLQVVVDIPLAYLEAETPPSLIIVVLNILNHQLLMAGIAGLAQSHAAGRGWLAGYATGSGVSAGYCLACRY